MQPRSNHAMDGLLVATLYCLAYLTAWFNALDQWLLPAGIRAAALLLLPRRWLGWWLLGDIVAMLLMRIPRAAFDGILWAWLTPFILGPLIAIVPLTCRALLRTPDRIAAWFPLIAVLSASWGWACNLALSELAISPNVFADAHMAVTWSVGSFLGIVVVVLPALLWRTRASHRLSLAAARDAVAAAVVVIAVHYAVSYASDLDQSMRIGLLMLMALPAVFLTFGHGWRGAAIGVWMANVGAGLTLPDFKTEGGHDAVSFVAQQALCVASGALLALGHAISLFRARAESATLIEMTARAMAQTSYRATERELREKLLLMARLQAHLDRGRQHTVDALREAGALAAALDLNSLGVTHRATYEAHAAALYPIQLEHDGLFAVLAGDAFARYWVGDAVRLKLEFRGNPRLLSTDLQLSAYRAACQSVAILQDRNPTALKLRVRVWRKGARHGVVLSVAAATTARHAWSAASLDACRDLAHRAQTHDGALKVRHHANRLLLLMGELGINDPQADPQTKHRPRWIADAG